MKKLVELSLDSNYSINDYNKKIIYSIIKRLGDVFIALVSLILLCGVFLAIAITIKLTTKGRVFYFHDRVGKNGKHFKVYKFRTMIDSTKSIEELLSKEQLEQYLKEYKVDDDPRITRIGQILRKTSLDEIPQLINILFGEMSVVGFRPIIEKELNLYGNNKDLLVKIKPGLTGFWAANGRSSVTYENRIKMELFYVINRNLWLDIRIVFKTFYIVLSRKGAK